MLVRGIMPALRALGIAFAEDHAAVTECLTNLLQEKFRCGHYRTLRKAAIECIQRRNPTEWFLTLLMSAQAVWRLLDC